ncbi:MULTISPECIES: M48 family metallopeptidase [Lysobacter]|jgi:predicted Zn-dependent protease|uniref:M48 family metallopeptidase n=1 Tax=Lysobacter gummosus TaxID=262324 RepID=A0ABY3XE82_9GAMM|nr:MULTISPECIES: M48 family metallopeptidase [Lysobacter]ALN88996.1 peptidase M48 family protein [Lysobacter gummosus]UJB19031.1 M48 family metallopeptidase [Lysobacter capsici]UJQ27244.1 M48 family metallopeptidase [Lysobacter gummosus]UNP29712.1 M48 family metallopeptidase [Lysobacter gummosus]
MKRLVLGLSIASLVAACATTTSPTGRTQHVGAISKAQLDQMGAQAFEETKSKERLSTDARQNAYVRCVVNSITGQLPPGWQSNWEVAVFVDSSPNAFALPGGKVGVNTGIFTVAKNQDQLAAVISHEIGHVVSRHHDERITRQMGSQAALNILGTLMGARYGDGAASATSQLGGAALQTAFLLPGSRTQESEADVVGQRLMAQAGYDPRQAVNLWQNMISASSSRPPQWLSTHPDPQSRIHELNARAGSLIPVYEQARAAGRTPKCG